MPRTKESSEVRRKYEFIIANQGEHKVRTMCRLLGVAPSGNYAWLKNPMSDRAMEDARLLRLIRASFKASQGVYGAPRVFLVLREAGETCIARPMREDGLRAQAGTARVDTSPANPPNSFRIWPSETLMCRSPTAPE